MARRTTAGLELKCRRCKRVVVVPVDDTRDDWIEVPMR
jgi:phage FluMu protein Com